MDRTNQLVKLERLYGFHQGFLKGYRFSCTPGCSTCCTTNLLVTSLEMDFILSDPSARKTISERLGEIDIESLCLFRPHATINESAGFYLRMEEPPEATDLDEAPPAPSPCPLLSSEGLCTIYERRPFACRQMVSSSRCAHGGMADMEPFIVTINLAIQQIIEHLDQGGLYGNMWDMASFMIDGTGRERLKENLPIPGFLLMPSEKGRFMAFLRRLKKETDIELPFLNTSP